MEVILTVYTNPFSTLIPLARILSVVKVRSFSSLVIVREARFLPTFPAGDLALTTLLVMEPAWKALNRTRQTGMTMMSKAMAGTTGCSRFAAIERQAGDWVLAAKRIHKESRNCEALIPMALCQAETFNSRMRCLVEAFPFKIRKSAITRKARRITEPPRALIPSDAKEGAIMVRPAMIGPLNRMTRVTSMERCTIQRLKRYLLLIDLLVLHRPVPDLEEGGNGQNDDGSQGREEPRLFVSVGIFPMPLTDSPALTPEDGSQECEDPEVQRIEKTSPEGNEAGRKLTGVGTDVGFVVRAERFILSDKAIRSGFGSFFRKRNKILLMPSFVHSFS